MHRASTTNLQRRYRHLFALPPQRVAFTLATVMTVLLAALASARQGVSLFELATRGVVSLAVVIVAVPVELSLFRRNPLATARRLAAVSFIGTSLWLLTLSLGSIVAILAAKPVGPVSLAAVTSFYALAFRFLVFRAVFTTGTGRALAAALLQVVVLGMVLEGGPQRWIAAIREPVPAAAGVSLLAAVALYLRRVDRAARPILPAPSFHLLQAFLLAWAEEQPQALERIVEASSTSGTVGAQVLRFNAPTRNASLIIPELHPGPFYPVGSSNLPYDLHHWFRSHDSIPIVTHGVSGHELNLPSRGEVDHFLAMLAHLRVVAQASSCTVPVTVTVNRGTVSAITFGDVALLTLTLAPNGMEDFPESLLPRLEAEAQALGFQHVLVVDCHNSQGTTPSATDCDDVVAAGRTALARIRELPQQPFRAAAAHSEALGVAWPADVGPAGCAVLLLEVDGQQFAFVAFDANNAVMGLREAVFELLQAEEAKTVELFTSDTHVTAGKTLGPRGYLALGELLSPADAAVVIRALIKEARRHLAPTLAALQVMRTTARVLGAASLEEFSTGVDRVTRVARRGGLSLVGYAAALLIAILVI